MSLNIQTGDLIQYRYKVGIVARRTVRKVVGIERDADGKEVYVVEGGFWVAKKDVLAKIPMHEKQVTGGE